MDFQLVDHISRASHGEELRKKSTESQQQMKLKLIQNRSKGGHSTSAACRHKAYLEHNRAMVTDNTTCLHGLDEVACLLKIGWTWGPSQFLTKHTQLYGD
ncbi:hypothetical protein OPV22_022915 [Ensete ventricosum]|uniref:Uncharacterized protein n=1 Tax=Ensete ventricosum TaxID=4639 RepID=A0AAV8QVL3_ENSVE|nr:hypothetical protein OPV22_022915 [Ensete ventricosum]